MKKKFTLISFLILTLLFSLSFTACGGKGSKGKKPALTPQGESSDKDVYQKARKMIKRNPEKARLLFKEIMHLYPDSIYARRSKVGIADSYFRQKDASSLIMAASEYQEYVNLYPHSPDAVFAKLQIALCYYKQVKKPGRDQTNTHQAIKSLDAMVKMYPDSPEAEAAKKMLAKARLTLAKHYFDIGMSDYRLGAPKGAIVRFKQVVDEYPEFPQMDKLSFYTGKSYYYMYEFDTAISFFQKIISSYPKSKYQKKAAAMIPATLKMKEKIEKLKKLHPLPPPAEAEETKEEQK